ncbi:MAG: IS4/IS5 family transposase, partial [Mogibacterium sp.]|nr:IS4/IS5 family transposase [Mogibacterium sp.]
MNAACVKQSLLDKIENHAEHPELYCQNPGRDFTRKRKLSFSALVSFILNMHGGSMTHEIIDFFL